MGPQKLRAGTFEQPSPGAEPTWLEPESAAAKGSPGRGVYKPVPGLRSTERKGSLCRVQRLELQGASHGSVPFTQVCSHVPALSAVPPDTPPSALEALPPGLPDLGNNRGLSPNPLACPSILESTPVLFAKLRSLGGLRFPTF